MIHNINKDDRNTKSNIDTLLNTIKSRNKLNQLLNIVSNDISHTRWYPAIDSHCINIMECYDFKNKINNFPIDSLIQLHSLLYQTISNKQNIQFAEFDRSTYLLNFDNKTITYPETQYHFPSSEDVKNKFLDGLLVTTVHSTDGYNFTSEYLNIYKGKTDLMSIYNDTIVIIKRAIVATDNIMILTDDDIEKYSGE